MGRERSRPSASVESQPLNDERLALSIQITPQKLIPGGLIWRLGIF